MEHRVRRESVFDAAEAEARRLAEHLVREAVALDVHVGEVAGVDRSADKVAGTTVACDVQVIIVVAEERLLADTDLAGVARAGVLSEHAEPLEPMRVGVGRVREDTAPAVEDTRRTESAHVGDRRGLREVWVDASGVAAVKRRHCLNEQTRVEEVLEHAVLNARSRETLQPRVLASSPDGCPIKNIESPSVETQPRHPAVGNLISDDCGRERRWDGAAGGREYTTWEIGGHDRFEGHVEPSGGADTRREVVLRARSPQCAAVDEEPIRRILPCRLCAGCGASLDTLVVELERVALPRVVRRSGHAGAGCGNDLVPH